MLGSFTGSTQVVEETIQLDTITEKIKVIYRTSFTNPTTHYTKKIAVFANDTSQVAIEKTILRDKLNGIYKVFYPSGKQKVKAVYVEGKPSGEFTWYNENGIIRVKGIYKDSIKHGFWAYKYLKIYGRYKHGKKHGRWYILDASKKKIKSWYKFGKLVRGKGFEYNETIPLETDTLAKLLASTPNDSSKKQITTYPSVINEKYEQVIYYLKNNLILKKTLKAYFGEKTKDLWKFKKNYKNDVFQFSLSETILPLSLNPFIIKSENGEMVVAKIDSVLKNTSNLTQKFSDVTPKKVSGLNDYSSNKNAAITIYFSEIIDNLMRVDVIWNKEEKEFNTDIEQFEQIEKNKKFSILLYFNHKGELAGAEYQ